MLAIDKLAVLNLGATFAIFVLPAWTVFRLQKPIISIPIGGLIFWSWLVLLGGFTHDLDPSYDSIAPAINFFFGLPFGLGYCVFWEAIRQYVQRKKKVSPRKKKVSPNAVDLILWSFLIALCICFPFIFQSVYRRDPMDYFFEILLGIGPILMLCIAMVLKLTIEKLGSDPMKSHTI